MKRILLTLMLLTTVIMAGAATKPQKVGPRPSKFAPVALKDSKAGKTKHVIRRAEGQTINLDFSKESSDNYIFQYYGGDYGFQYFSAYDENANVVICLAYYADDKYGTFDYSCIDTDYSRFEQYNSDGNIQKYMMFMEGSEFTMAQQDGYLVISGTFPCDDGNTYQVSAKCKLPEPKTYDIEGSVITMAEYYDEDQDWYIRFKDADESWKVTLDLISTNGDFAGTYTLDNAFFGYITDLNEDMDYTFTEMSVTITHRADITDPKQGCEITGYGKDADGNTYNFHMLKNPPILPKEVKTIEVTVDKAEWPSETNYGGAYYELTEKANTNNRWALALSPLTGTASVAENTIDTDMSGRLLTDTEQSFQIDNGQVTQTLDAEKMALQVEASLVLTDSIQYNFTFSTPIDIQGSKELSFSDLHVDHAYSEYGSTSLQAGDEWYMLSAQLTDYATIPGEYTGENCIPELSVYEDDEIKTVSCLALIEAKATEATDGSPVFHVKFLGDNRILYTADANYIEPAITDTLHYDFDEEVGMGDDTAWDDGIYFYYYGDTEMAWIKINGSEATGHFTEDQINENSVIALTGEVGMGRYYYLKHGEFTITTDGANWKLEGTAQAGSHFVYITMNYQYQGLDYDTKDADVDVAFTADDIQEISYQDESGVSYIYVKLVNKERNDELCLIVVPESCTSAVIPQGYYSITSWDSGNYIQSGTPYDGDIIPSYYAKLDTDGTPLAPLWFITSGDMTVNEGDTNTSFEINGQNSYSRTVHVTFDVPTAIQSVVNSLNTADGKYLRQGRVIIRKNGAEYNLSGIRK